MTGKATQTRVLKVVMDNKASAETKKIAKDVAKLNNNVKKTAKSMKGMNSILGQARTAFAGLAAAMGVRELARSADAYQLVKDRIRALWGEGVDANAVFKQVAKVAQDTNAPVETLADGFARISLSAKGMGLTVSETARGVKSLQQTLRLSGASVAEVNSVYLQFSQAMGLSRLQGQELRAVMLGNAKLAQLLAEEFNTTRGALRDLGEKGLLDTARIFQMLVDRGGELDKQASKLRVTFGQGMIKLFDAFRLQIDKLNTALGGTEGFNSLIQVVIKNMGKLFIAITAIVSSGVFYKMALGIQAVGAAFLKWWGGATLALLMGPQGIVVGIAALAAAIVSLSLAMKLQEKPAEQSIKHLTALYKTNERLLVVEAKLKKDRKTAASILKSGREYNKTALENAQKGIFYGMKEIRVLKKLQVQQEAAVKASRKRIEVQKKIPVQTGEFSKLNKEYDKAIGLTAHYIAQLRKMETLKVEKEFEKGKISALAYEQQLEKINKTYDDLLKKMDDIANSGSVWHGIKNGAEEYVKSVGNVAEETAKVTTQAFNHLEDNLMDFIKTGKFEFSKFAQSIMDDITRMVIRMSIVKPLAGAISNIGTGYAGSAGTAVTTTSDGSQYANLSAKGNAFSKGNLIPFATGGVVTRPTTFGMSGGRTGLMGEAGPEAILPLSRGSNGKLGVQGSGTTVNVINNSSAETETKETTNNDGSKQIDVYIVNKVGEAIGEGRFDKSFKQIYGMQRRGN